MSTGPRRSVSFADLDEAMSFASDGVIPYLHRETGEIETLFDVDGDPEVLERIDADFHRYVEIPGYSSRRDYEHMAEFAESVEEEDIREQLAVALSGRRGVFGRFRDIIRRYDDLNRRFDDFMHRAHLEEVKEWLEDEGVELELTVRDLPPPPPPREQPAPEREPDLIDLLMLGGKAELVEGAVHRHVHFDHPQEARAAFVRLARQVVELSGRAWRRRYVKNTSEVHVDRFRLVHDGRHVRLFVETPPHVYVRFGD